MIRTFLTEAALFLAPFAVFALYLWLRKQPVFVRDPWTARVVVVLTAIAAALVIGSLLLLAQFGGFRPGGTYVPAHIEDGRLVPGTTR